MSLPEIILEPDQEKFSRFFKHDEKFPEMADNYKRAYLWLKERGLHVYDCEAEKEAMINDFRAKVDGPCLVDLAALEEAVTEKKKGKTLSKQIDYHEAMDLFEEAYGISVRGFFGDLDDYQQTAKDLELVESDYEKYSNISPSKSEISARICLRTDIVRNKIEYVDFWHYMLDTSWDNISNGCIAHLATDYEFDYELDKRKNKICQLIYQGFVKELKQIEGLENQYGTIECWISW